jgi:hypothetical protein
MARPIPLVAPRPQLPITRTRRRIRARLNPHQGDPHVPNHHRRRHHAPGTPGRLMVDLIGYGGAFVLFALAALLPNGVPHRDRLAYAGLALWVLPSLAPTLQAH